MIKATPEILAYILCSAYVILGRKALQWKSVGKSGTVYSPSVQPHYLWFSRVVRDDMQGGCARMMRLNVPEIGYGWMVCNEY